MDYDEQIEREAHPENFEPPEEDFKFVDPESYSHFTEEEMDNFREEHLGTGECSFCHMPAETTPTYVCACSCHTEGGD